MVVSVAQVVGRWLQTWVARVLGALVLAVVVPQVVLVVVLAGCLVVWLGVVVVHSACAQ